MIIDGYTRISVDLQEDYQENTSIENQKRIIRDYVREHFPDAELRMYEDRDRSGYTFVQREQYQLMRKELMSGEVRILVVKDFSRFSRRNSLGLCELEELRDAGVRIISIGDNIDYPTKDDWILIQFKFLLNEMPVTDTSKKIKQIITSRQKSGHWVCAVPYGYRMINTKEMIYAVDPPAAENVREIFRLYNNGWGYKRIANHLTDTGVPTPRANEIARKESEGKRTKLRSKNEWSILSVSAILQNDFYIGTLRQKKYTRKGINGRDVRVSEEEQIVIENAHEPIIDTRTFAYTKEQIELRSKSNYRGEKKYATDYSGYLFCGDCGSPMFSMSRPDLAAAYTCGTYHRRGRKGCTSHHIRVDRLDELLKGYLLRVRDNCADMMGQLEQAIRQQPEREAELGRMVDYIGRQLSDAKTQLKEVYKQKILSSPNLSERQAEIRLQAYEEMEIELTKRIEGLEVQLEQANELRNTVIRTNRKAKTVMDVFDDIVRKPKLDKRDIGLIVERITVYEDHLNVRLRADVDTLLSLEDREEALNFPTDSKDIENETLVQSSTHRQDKVFAVNIINSGDPLEIYTERDGEVIFKKYSPMSDLQDFAWQICDSIGKNTGCIAAVSDRDSIIALSGAPKRELLEKTNSTELAKLMEQRRSYRYMPGSTKLQVVEDADKYHLGVAAPIISSGDLMGCVMLLMDESGKMPDEGEQKLAQTVATFLGQQMEN